MKKFLFLFSFALALNLAILHLKFASTYSQRENWSVRKEATPFENFGITNKFAGGKLHLSRNAQAQFKPDKNILIHKVTFQAHPSMRSFFYVYFNKNTNSSMAVRFSATQHMPMAFFTFHGFRVHKKTPFKTKALRYALKSRLFEISYSPGSSFLTVRSKGKKLFTKKLPEGMPLRTLTFLAGDNGASVDDVKISAQSADGKPFLFFEDFTHHADKRRFFFELFVLSVATFLITWLVYFYLYSVCVLPTDILERRLRGKLKKLLLYLIPGMLLFVPIPIHIALLLTALFISAKLTLRCAARYGPRFKPSRSLFPENTFAEDMKKFAAYFILCGASALFFKHALLYFEHKAGFSSGAAKNASQPVYLEPLSTHFVHSQPSAAFTSHADIFIPVNGAAAVNFLQKKVPVSTDDSFRSGLAFGDFYTLILSCDADFPSRLFFVADIVIKPDFPLRPPRRGLLRCGNWNQLTLHAHSVFVEIFVNGRLFTRTMREIEPVVKTNVVSFHVLQKDALLDSVSLTPLNMVLSPVKKYTEKFYFVFSGLARFALFLFYAAVFAKLLSLHLRAPYKDIYRKVFYSSLLLGLGAFISVPMRETGHAFSLYVMALIFSAALFFSWCGFYVTHRRKLFFISALYVAFFLEASSFFYACYARQFKTPWWEASRSQKYYWFLDPQVRLHNNFFAFYEIRGRQYELNKNVKKRIVTLGGSQTWGEGIAIASRNVFSFLLEDLLNAAMDKNKFEVINGASGAANSFTQLEFFKGTLLSYKPDLVILNFSHNDAAFDRGEQKQYGNDEQSAKKGNRYSPIRHSLVLTLSRNFLYRVSQSIWSVFIQRFVLRLRGSEEKKVRILKENLRAFCAFSKTHDFKLLFLLEPYYITTRRTQDAPIKKMYETLKAVAGECDAPYIDTFSIFFKHRDEDLFLDGLHLSEGGHALMADEIMKFLTRRKKKDKILFN